MIDEQYREVAGQRLRVVTTAGEGRPLLLFNGIGASAELVRPLLQGLDLPSITFDLPGVGASAASVIPRRMWELSNLSRCLLEDLGIDRCHVMGISWGGGLAQQFAKQYPQVTDRLVLAATSTGALSVPPKLSVLLAMATPWRYFSASHLRNIAGDIYGGDFRGESPSAQGRIERHARLMSPPSVWGYLSQLYAMAGWTSYFWLDQVRAPTLVMAGDDDPIIPLTNARIMTARLPDARLRVFDCGHLFVLTRLPEVLDELHAFLGDATDDGYGATREE